MTRFLYEDSQLPDTPLSNTALQRDAKARTHAVIQRSGPGQPAGGALPRGDPSLHPQAAQPEDGHPHAADPG
jgi:hypothetical protein